MSERFAYLSSGTWSLMGIEVKDAIINAESFDKNFTNEGGIEGTTRFLKNICGMWLLERCRKEWTEDYSYSALIEAALSVPAFRSIINPDAPCFANPTSMIEAIKQYCRETSQPVPETYGELTRCIFDSLALRYRQVVEMMRELSPTPINRLYVIGGGARNETLNQFTASAIGIPVETGSAESTAIGNVMMQAKWVGVVDSIDAMRSMIRSSIDDRRRYEPQQSEVWSAAYEKFLSLYREM
jgi:rhamnulokinase